MLGIQDLKFYLTPSNEDVAFVFLCFEDKAYLKYYNPTPKFYGQLNKYGNEELYFNERINIAIR